MNRTKNLLNLIGDRLATLPLVVLYLTDGCNSRCISCDIWKLPRRNISLELVDNLILQLVALNTRHVLLSGGEAMQHPSWHEIAAKFQEAGIRVMLLTNGLLVQKQIELVSENVNELIVSLDAAEAELYQHIRGVDAFDLVLRGIQLTAERGIPVTTRTTVQRANFRQIPQIIDVALSHGVESVSFLAVDVSNPFAFGERFTDDTVIPLQDQSMILNLDEITELEQIINQLEKDHAADFESGRIAESPEKLRRILAQYFRSFHETIDYPRPRCNAPHFSTVIEVDGTLRPCYFLPSYGKLDSDLIRLPAILNNNEAQRLRNAYQSGQRRECERCVCPLYKGARSLLRF